MAEQNDPEWAFVVDLASLPRGGRDLSLEADEETRARIARRLQIPAVNRLASTLRVSASLGEIQVTGQVRAELVRECVASLEEITETVDEVFEIEFLRQPPDLPEAPDEDDEDWLNAPEVHEDPTIDAAELVIQQLSLAMDPFPRKPGARSLAEEYGREEEPSPFAELLAKTVKSEKKQ